MNDKCKYCDYVSKCSRKCEYDSILCITQRSFPKVVDKSYEQLQQENKKYKEVIDKAIEYIEKDYYSKNTFDIDNIGMTTNKLLQVRNILKEVE